MLGRDLLSIYLNDHLAGAIGGLELARRARGSNEGTPLGDALARIVGEIAEDRETLLVVEVTNKLALWRALEGLAPSGIDGFDFAALAQRAERQRDELEALRLDASDEALAADLGARIRDR